MKETHADRADLWLQRNRPDRAEAELRKALSEDPEDRESHVMLALSLVALERYDEAREESLRALALDGDLTLAHYARAAALMGMGRHKQAESVAQKVIEQDPASSLAYGLLALALGAQHRWRESLQVADEGLTLDPEDEDCINARAVALIQLGEMDEADGALAAALHRDPENPHTHRNIAWQALRGGDAQRAVTHYREALRLAPEDTAAREGLVEALKSRNIVYRFFLRTVLLLTKVPPRTVMAIFVGTVVARMLLRRVADAVPALAPILTPLFWALVAFVLMTWIAPALFNLLLRMDREGKHALSDAQRTQTNWLGGTLFVGALCLLLWIVGVPAMGLATIYAALLTIPITATFSPEPGKRHLLLGVMTIGLVLVGVASVVAHRDLHARVAEGRAALHQVRDDLRAVAESPEAVAAWSEADRERVEADVEARAAELSEAKAASDRAVQSSLIFFWGFVIFTWIASTRGVFGRSR